MQTRQPYGEWLDSNLVQSCGSEDSESATCRSIHEEERARLQKAFGYTYEDVQYFHSDDGAERSRSDIAAMGIDTPLAVLSEKHQPLFNYFKQLFAQVTNPPIDAIREEVVTSTTIYVGEDGNLLEEKAENCQVLKVNNPILTNTDLLKIKNMKMPKDSR